MKKPLFAILAILTLPGCPYTEGCSGPADVSENTTESSPTDPGVTDPGTDGPSSAVPATRAKSAPIDFGSDPGGGPRVSTLSCPVLAMPLPGGSGAVYVDAAARGEELGTKGQPFKTIAKAFASAKQASSIWVAKGTYRENLVVPDKDLVVFGGFSSDFAMRGDACATVIEAANTKQPVFSAGRDVASFALEGVTVQKGARGIVVTGDETLKASFTIARSVFKQNGTKTEVGGAAALDGVNGRVFQSVFVDNIASKGAALANGGDVELAVDQNLFEHNLGYSDHGGGLYLSARLSRVYRNTFIGNETGVDTRASWGGAIIVYKQRDTSPARGELSFNVFTDNLAGLGSAVFVDEGATVTMSHDLVYRNRAYAENGYIRGAALYVDGTGHPGGGSTLVGEFLTVANNVYDENRVSRAATAFGGNVYVESSSKTTITNSIFWNNGNNGFYVEAGNEITVSHTIASPSCASSDAKGLVVAGPASCKIGAGVFLPEDIAFADEAEDDYHEKSTAGRFTKEGRWVVDSVTSPAIDKGDPGAVMRSEPAPNGGRSNLGAFADTVEASKSPVR
ncbi:MAG: DUF1565 domain-containing protein [Deltaproteobacteria bacterium]|nr:DUF1565 domain-containing protein [Deltaproteobacteria bacterium]